MTLIKGDRLVARVSIAIAIALCLVLALNIAGFKPSDWPPQRPLVVETIPVDLPMVPSVESIPTDVINRSEIAPSHERTAFLLFLDAVTSAPVQGCVMQDISEEEIFSDQFGFLRLQVLAPDFPRELSVLHPIYEPKSIVLDSSNVGTESNPIEVLLIRKGGIIQGLVVPEVGESLPPNTVVVAWPSGHTAPKVVKGKISNAGKSLWCVTDELGSFTLVGVEANLSYRLVACGEGALTAVPLLARSGQNLEVPIAPVFGVVLLFEDAAGGDLLTNSQVQYSVNGVSFTTQKPLRANRCPPSLWPLAGAVGNQVLEYSNSNWHQSIVATVKGQPGESEKLLLTVRIPGYEKRKEEIEIPRLEMGQARVVRVPLRRVSTDWFTLPIEIRRSQIQEEIPDESATCSGKIFLNPIDDTEKKISVFIPRLENGLIRIPGVPAGEYYVRFESTSRFFQVPAPGEVYGNWVHLVNQKEDSLIIDLSGAGAIEIVNCPTETAGQYCILQAKSGGRRMYFPIQPGRTHIDSLFPAEYLIDFASSTTDLISIMNDGSSAPHLLAVSSGETEKFQFPGN